MPTRSLNDPLREYLATLDGERTNAIGSRECANAFGKASPVEPKFNSHSDPASQWTGARGGPAYFAYSTNDLIDTDNGVILPSRRLTSKRLPGNGCRGYECER
jgi:hypothetical protein